MHIRLPLLTLILALATGALLIPVAALKAAPETPADFTVKDSIRAIDGSTVEVWSPIEDRRWGIGYIGAETPEGNTPCGQAAWGRQWALTGGGLRFEADSRHGLDEKDRRLYHAFTDASNDYWMTVSDFLTPTTLLLGHPEGTPEKLADCMGEIIRG